MTALTNARQNTVLLVFLLAAQLLLMSGSVRGASGSTVLETWMMRFSSPLTLVSQTLGGAVRSATMGARDLFAARARNVVLESDVARLARELEQRREAEEENRRLRMLLGMREQLTPKSIAASIVTSTLDGNTRALIIDRGTADGVRPELAVVAWGGAVGRVEHAFRNHSKVRLLTDPNSGVAAVVQRSRAKGIVLGHAGPTLELRYVPRFSDVMHGDRVITSGLDGIFPRGFGIGLVSSIHEAPDGVLTLELQPALDYRSLEDVLVVLEPVAEDLLAPVQSIEEDG